MGEQIGDAENQNGAKRNRLGRLVRHPQSQSERQPHQSIDAKGEGKGARHGGAIGNGHGAGTALSGHGFHRAA